MWKRGEEIGRARGETERRARCVESTGGRLDLENGSSGALEKWLGYILETISSSCCCTGGQE